MRKFVFVLATLLSITACGGLRDLADGNTANRPPATDGTDTTDNTSDTVEVEIMFDIEFEMNGNVTSLDRDGDELDSASDSSGNADTLSVELENDEDLEWIEAWVNLDGGWPSGEELAYNGGDSTCHIHPDFDRITVDGDELDDVVALPHHCSGNDPSDCDDEAPESDEGCNLFGRKP